MKACATHTILLFSFLVQNAVNANGKVYNALVDTQLASFLNSFPQKSTKS